jgi:predicted extracellular nuclease
MIKKITSEIFSRDCPEVDFSLPDGKNLTVFINHLKSEIQRAMKPMRNGGWPICVKGHKKRLRQAQVVAELVEKTLFLAA